MKQHMLIQTFSYLHSAVVAVLDKACIPTEKILVSVGVSVCDLSS